MWPLRIPTSRAAMPSAIADEATPATLKHSVGTRSARPPRSVTPCTDAPGIASDRVEQRARQRPLVLGDRAHRRVQPRRARRAARSRVNAPPEILEIADRGVHPRDVLVDLCAGLELVGRHVRNELLAKRRQAVDRLAPAPRESHVRREDLVAGADEKVAVDRLDVDRAVRAEVHGVEKELRADAVRAPRDVGDVDETARRVRRDRAGDEPRPLASAAPSRSSACSRPSFRGCHHTMRAPARSSASHVATLAS